MGILRKGRSARDGARWLGTEIKGKTPAEMMKSGKSREVWEILKKEETGS